jgi:hypothetical protein
MANSKIDFSGSCFGGKPPKSILSRPKPQKSPKIDFFRAILEFRGY